MMRDAGCRSRHSQLDLVSGGRLAAESGGTRSKSSSCDEIMSYSLPKILIVILIQVAIALIHVFRLGQIFQGQAYKLYYSYFSDFILPFGAYFLLSLNEVAIPVLRRWYVKAGLIFALTTCAEICQFFGIEVLGVTFDPFDMLMYGMGVSAAAFIDVKVFTKYLGFWANPKNGREDQAGLRLT
jgi:hypothetical protein